jgi:hypothetical protein
MIFLKFLEGMLIHPYIQDALMSENMVQRDGITAELKSIFSAGVRKNDSI